MYNKLMVCCLLSLLLINDTSIAMTKVSPTSSTSSTVEHQRKWHEYKFIPDDAFELLKEIKKVLPEEQITYKDKKDKKGRYKVSWNLSEQDAPTVDSVTRSILDLVYGRGIIDHNEYEDILKKILNPGVITDASGHTTDRQYFCPYPMSNLVSIIINKIVSFHMPNEMKIFMELNKVKYDTYRYPYSKPDAQNEGLKKEAEGVLKIMVDNGYWATQKADDNDIWREVLEDRNEGYWHGTFPIKTLIYRAKLALIGNMIRRQCLKTIESIQYDEGTRSCNWRGQKISTPEYFLMKLGEYIEEAGLSWKKDEIKEKIGKLGYLDPLLVLNSEIFGNIKTVVLDVLRNTPIPLLNFKNDIKDWGTELPIPILENIESFKQTARTYFKMPLH